MLITKNTLAERVKKDWGGNIKDYKTCKDCAEVGELLECYGLGEMYEQLWDCELIGKDEEDEGKVISLDDR